MYCKVYAWYTFHRGFHKAGSQKVENTGTTMQYLIEVNGDLYDHAQFRDMIADFGADILKESEDELPEAE